MNETVRKILDPLGNEIVVVSELLKLPDENAENIFDDISATLKKPALLIEITNQDEKTILHYFRSLSWHHTLLVSVRQNNNNFEVYKLEINPDAKELNLLLTMGKSLI